MYMARPEVFLFSFLPYSVCYPLFGPLNVTDFGLPLGQFGRAGTTQHMVGWMCLNKYAKFATFVRAEAAADFFFFSLYFFFVFIFITVVVGFDSAGSAGFVFPPFRRHFC